jgi:4-amino-4-deoxy-L-arabinose transferase-like glycosyltransferase
MKQKEYAFPGSWFNKWFFPLGFVVVLLIASLLRFYQLAQVPHGMTWDEAAIGYNGHAVLTTRRDEWLKRLPISFRSFGDYKAPLAIYINGLFTLLFGMNLWAVRLPFALASIVGIAGWMILVKSLWEDVLHSDRGKEWALTAGAMMALSPWHFHFSRIGFESGMALNFLIWGMVGVIWLLFKPIQKVSSNILLLVFTSGMFVSSIYSYHSSKIMIPLLIVTILVLYFKRAWLKKIYLGLLGLLSAILLVPFIYDSVWASGGERLTQATIFGLHLPFYELLSRFGQNFLIHLSPTFLVQGATTTLRQGDGQWGVLYITTFILVICGLVLGLRQLIFQSLQKNSFERIKFFGLALAWVVVGVIPAAIGRDVPHSNRALLAMPGFFLLALYGLDQLVEILRTSKLNKLVSGSKGEKNLLVKSVLGMFVLVHAILAASYLAHYFRDFNKISANDFQDGYLEAMEYAKQHEASADKILFTSAYGQPYIYALFSRQTNPIWYQGGALIKYEFSDRINPGDMSRSNTVIIATPQEIEADRGQAVIKDAAGKVRFVLMKTP